MASMPRLISNSLSKQISTKKLSLTLFQVNRIKDKRPRESTEPNDKY